VVLLREGYPVHVLNQLEQVPEACSVYCATANQVEVVFVERRQLLRTIGHKLVARGRRPLALPTTGGGRKWRLMVPFVPTARAR
jgi:adenosine/AMP kinase